MPETVDDFIQRFGGSGRVDDRQATRYFDRFASTRDEDRDFDNNALYEGATQHLGRLDDDEFTRASTSAYQQAPPPERRGLLQTILSGIQGHGGDFGNIARQIGLRSTDPNQMDDQDFARLENYTRREHPDVMQQAVREKPWIVKAMGNPIVLGALTMAAANMLKNQRQRSAGRQSSGIFR
jgi:hypothetical protein